MTAPLPIAGSGVFVCRTEIGSASYLEIQMSKKWFDRVAKLALLAVLTLLYGVLPMFAFGWLLASIARHPEVVTALKKRVRLSLPDVVDRRSKVGCALVWPCGRWFALLRYRAGGS
jgi:hypothetical protein